VRRLVFREHVGLLQLLHGVEPVRVVFLAHQVDAPERAQAYDANRLLVSISRKSRPFSNCLSLLISDVNHFNLKSFETDNFEF
jgi:hypothetical protein